MKGHCKEHPCIQRCFHDEWGTGEGYGVQGGRRGRLFKPGYMKLLALYVLDQRPRHGYEVIRTIGEMAGGDYSPSPGTVYPTLSYLEDKGYVNGSALDDGRKQYSITVAGKVYLDEQKVELDAALAKLHQHRSHARARCAPDIQRAMENLKTALRLRFAEELPETEVVQRMAEIIDRAAVEIGRL